MVKKVNINSYILLLIIYIITIPLYSQEGEEGAESGSEVPLSKEETPASGEESVEKEGALSLFLRTLIDDINTATYYELIDLCHQLGLDSAGDLNALKQRIFSFYNIKPEEVKAEEKKITRKIEIKSAKKSEYFTIGEIDESYLVLEGNVVVEVVDLEKNVRHNIKAQRITLNQTENILTAEQDIEYILTRGEGTPEIFKGESFSFNINSWEGVFYRGEGETEREVEEGKKTTFVYKGDAISRLADDTIILDKGIITSDKSPENPFWKITATKIWVLAPGEWAIFNAVLHIGTIPVFYIPFFFYPGDELFFHPVIGYKEREGTFLQTTTYIFGEKEKKKSPFSFLRVTEEESKKYRKQLKGLFLRQVEDEKPVNEATKDWLLKVMVDIYLRLGGFIGIEGNITNKFTIKGGVALSRSLFYNSYGNFYTPYYDSNGDNKVEEYWNSTNLFGMTIPLRYALATTFTNINLGDISTNGRMELFSDPYFEIDFYDRKEDLDLTELIGMSEIEETPQILPTLKKELKWSLNTTVNLSKYMPQPLINQMSISQLDLSFDWNSKDAENWYGNETLYNADPARTFYYPLKLYAPDMKMNIGGTLLNITSGTQDAARQKAIEKDPGKGFKNPFKETGEVPITADGQVETGGEQKKQGVITEPEIITEKNGNDGWPPSTHSSFSLTYSINPEVKYETHYDATNWEKMADIDFSTWFMFFQTHSPLKLDYKTDVFGDYLMLHGYLSFNGWYKTSFNPSPNYTEENWDKQLLNDYEGTYLSLTNSIDYTLKPFYLIKELTSSFINYKLDWILYKYRFDELRNNTPLYTADYFIWDNKMVTDHSLNTSIQYNPDIFTLTTACNLAKLPPLLMSINPTISLVVWLLTSSIGTEIYEKSANNWKFKPLGISEIFNWDPYIYLSEKLTYDVEAEVWEDSTTNINLFHFPGASPYLIQQELVYNFIEQQLTDVTTNFSLWGFKADFNATKMQPFKFDVGNGIFVPDTDKTERFLAKLLTMSYNPGALEWYLWKNRIKLNTTLTTEMQIYFEEFSISNFSVKLDINIFIQEFLDINFSVRSYNDRLFLYFPGFVERLPPGYAETVNVFDDLLKSFNFFNERDRIITNFKMDYIDLSLVHHLYDWDLTFQFHGDFQELIVNKKQWYPTFSIFIEWIPIPEIKKEVTGQGDAINIIGG